VEGTRELKDLQIWVLPAHWRIMKLEVAKIQQRKLLLNEPCY